MDAHDKSQVRFGAAIALRPGAAPEYDRLHRNVWPEVLERLRVSNIGNYTIFRRGELLFSSLEYRGDDYAADLRAVAADEVTRRWWRLTEPLQQRLPGAPESEWWSPLIEVFHLD